MVLTKVHDQDGFNSVSRQVNKGASESVLCLLVMVSVPSFKYIHFTFFFSRSPTSI